MEVFPIYGIEEKYHNSSIDLSNNIALLTVIDVQDIDCNIN